MFGRMGASAGTIAVDLPALEVLAEPSRRRILDLLRTGERGVGEIVGLLSDSGTGLSQPAVSKHLRVLREAGLVDVRPVAQQRLYHVVPGPLRELDDWLAPYRAMWENSLDALEAHLDSSRQPTGESR
jgi:DNA-binding transcriptional ArsR family regulator